MTNRARVLSARAMTCLGAAFIVAAMGSARAQVTKVISGDPIKTDAGLVSGTMSADGLKTYFGIPFAAPPHPREPLARATAGHALAGCAHGQQKTVGMRARTPLAYHQPLFWR
jgi:hypothetical protein